MAYIGKGLDNGVRNRFIYSSTQGQTAFTGSDLDGKTLTISDALYTDVYHNGVKIKLTTDWSSSTTTMTLVTGASVNDVIEIISFDVFGVPNTVPSFGGTFTGAISATSYGAVSGTTGTFSGNVGIGTTSPDAKAHIYSGTGGKTLVLENPNNDYSGIEFRANSLVEGRIKVANDGMHFFSDTGTSSQIMRLDPSGGISKNSSFSTSNAYDDFYWNTGTGSRFRFHSGITGSRNLLGFSNPNGQVGAIETNGSSTTYATSSDYRLKENVDYTWDATTRLKQLKPARFNFIADDTNTLVDGFLAHEVSSVVPEAISGVKDAMTVKVLYADGDKLPDGKSVGDVKEPSVIKPQGIDQSKLVPLLVKALQEQQVVIESLTTRITALEAE